jgi:hypothetical protein
VLATHDKDLAEKASVRFALVQGFYRRYEPRTPGVCRAARFWQKGGGKAAKDGKGAVERRLSPSHGLMGAILGIGISLVPCSWCSSSPME